MSSDSSYLSLLTLLFIVHIFELDDRLSVHPIRVLVALALAVVFVILPVVGVLSALVLRRRLA